MTGAADVTRDRIVVLADLSARGRPADAAPSGRLVDSVLAEKSGAPVDLGVKFIAAGR